MSCDWEGNRRSGVALAMVPHSLKWFIHLRVQGLSTGDEHPTNIPYEVRYSLPAPTGGCRGNHFCLSKGYRPSFGCVITSGMIFDSRGGFSESGYVMKTADFDVLRDVAMATNFGTKVAISRYRSHKPSYRL